MRSFLVFAVTLFIVCFLLGFCSRGAFGAKSTPHPTHAYVWTMPGCGPCARMKPAVDRLYAEGWEISFVDAVENQRLFEAWGLRVTPTVQVIRGVKEVARVTGYQSEEALLDLLNRTNVDRRSHDRRNPDPTACLRL